MMHEDLKINRLMLLKQRGEDYMESGNRSGNILRLKRAGYLLEALESKITADTIRHVRPYSDVD